MRPKLPIAERIAPYLKRIDAVRTYSNFGPLVKELQARLEGHFGLGEGQVVTVANATQGLALALAAQGAPAGSLCIMPAWTFIASAHAAVMAGLKPYFIDVDPASWAIDPGRAEAAIKNAPGPVGAVMPVAPYGAPLDIGAWDAFRAKHSIAVVIDAAAGFDALSPGDTPAVVSLHATKVIGVGEGGFIASRDAALIQDVWTRANFGFSGGREALLPATNAKLSEYHAAIGHASLDEWSDIRAEWMAAAASYRKALGVSNTVTLQAGFGESWISSTAVLRSERPAEEISARFARAGIETRQWWGAGAHRHAATKHLPVARLADTEDLIGSTLALPFYRDITPADSARVADAALAVF